MEKDVLEAISRIDEEIKDLQSQKELIEAFDFSKPVDEDTWHKICETPLRSSNLLTVLVKNIGRRNSSPLQLCVFQSTRLQGSDSDFSLFRDKCRYKLVQ